MAPLPLFAGIEQGVPLRCHPKKIQQDLSLHSVSNAVNNSASSRRSYSASGL